MGNCELCGKEYILGCEVASICKKHLDSFKQIYEQGRADERRNALLEAAEVVHACIINLKNEDEVGIRQNVRNQIAEALRKMAGE